MSIPIGDANWLRMRSEVYIRDKGICWICHEFVELKDYELGHLVDRCKDGENLYDNVAVMHKVCNDSKPLHQTLDEATRWNLLQNINHKHSIPLNNPLTTKFRKTPEWKKRANKRLKLTHSHTQINHTKLPDITPNNNLEVKPLTITWVQGKARWLIPPRDDGYYYGEDKFHCGRYDIINGSTKTIDELSTPESTIEVIGDINNTINNVTIALGIFIVNIYRDNGELKIKYTVNKSKANVAGTNRFTSTRTRRQTS